MRPAGGTERSKDAHSGRKTEQASSRFTDTEGQSGPTGHRRKARLRKDVPETAKQLSSERRANPGHKGAL